MTGAMKDKLGPTGTYIWVDVRDLALAHVRAMESPEAGGKRFLLTAGHFANTQIVDILRRAFPELDDQLPRGDEALKEGAMPPQGEIYTYDNSRSKEVLGITYRSLKECVVDTVRSLQAVGA